MSDRPTLWWNSSRAGRVTTLFLTESGAVLDIHAEDGSESVLRMELAGANSSPEIDGLWPISPQSCNNWGWMFKAMLSESPKRR